MVDEKLLKDSDKLYDKEEFSRALKGYLQIYSDYKENDTLFLSNLLLKISQCYLYNSPADIPKSREYAEKALDIHIKEGDDLKIAKDLIYLSTIDLETDQKKAENNLQKALDLALKNKNQYIEAEIFNHLGILYWSDKEKAMEYFKKARDISEKNKDLENFVLSLQNISYLEREHGELNKALTYLMSAIDIIDSYSKSLKKTERKSFKNSYSDIYDSAADLAMEMEDVELAMSIAAKLKDY
jgi:tetratricopeptide (TPR) repeat protein